MATKDPVKDAQPPAPPAKEEPKPPLTRKWAGHDYPAHAFVTVETLGDGCLNGHAYRAGELIDVPEPALDHFLRTGTGKLKSPKGKS